MTTEKTLPDVSREIGLTPDKARYWLSLLGIEAEKRNRTIIITPKAEKALLGMKSFVAEGFLPGEAAKKIKTASDEVQTLYPVPVVQNPIVDMTVTNNRLETVERALLLLVEQNQKVQGELINLRQENAALRRFLMPAEQPTAKVVPWQPEKPKDPVEGLAWYQRAWVQVFEPWKMRKYAS